MSARARILASVAAIVVVALAVGLWIIRGPGPLAFADGTKVTLADYHNGSPAGVPASLANADVVKRGEYLANAADCLVCHTTQDGKPYAGGLGFKLPFGTLYSTNITSDKETGIGNYSDQDFLNAVHRGVRRDGSRPYPAMPYTSYTYISDADALAIKAYLFSLPTVHAAAPPNRLGFPFDQRWLMGLWSAFYNPDQRFQPHEDRSPAWNRGAYVTEALAHCGDCHTPRNLAQALDNRRKFAGTVTQGWRAYNITPDAASGVGGWSDTALADYLHAGHVVGRGVAGGPMAEEVDDSLSLLAPSDIQAVVVYLRSIPGRHSDDLPAPRSTPASEAPKLIEASFDPRGKQIFEGACASCHSWSGVSLLTNYATLTGDRAVNDPSAVNVAQIVISGERRATPGGGVMMPAFGAAYSDTEIAAVANYVTARFGAAPSHLTARDVAQLRRASSR